MERLFSAQEWRLALLILALHMEARRIERILDACGGDLDHARRVLAELDRFERLAASRRERGAA